MLNLLHKKTMLKVLVALTLIVVMISGEYAIAARNNDSDGSWKAWRNDPGNSGIQILGGDITDPRLSEFSFERGAVSGEPLYSDITGDDNPEIIFIDSGKIVAIDQSGETLWISELLLAVQIYTVDDLNSSGKKEIMVFGQNQLIILNAEDGAIIYREDFQAQIARPRFILNDFDKDGSMEAVIWIYGDNDLYIYKFIDDNGRFDAILMNKIDGRGDRVDVFYPGFAYADTNNDGYEEFILIRYGGISIYDAKSFSSEEGKGTKPVSRLDYIPQGADNGRFYGYFSMKDVTGDGLPDGVIVADGVSMHVGVMKSSEDEGIGKLWEKYYGYSGRRGAGGKNVIMRAVNDSLLDAKGDGSQCLAYGIFEYVDGSPTGDWTLKIIDALDYEDENNVYLQGYYLWAIEEIGAGVPLFFLSKESTANPSRPSTYEIFAFDSDGEFKKIAGLSGALIQKSVHSPGNISPASYSGETRSYVLDVDNNGMNELLIYRGGRYEMISISLSGDIKVVDTIKPEKGSIYSHYRNSLGQLFFLTSDGDGVMRTYDMDGNEIWQYQCGGAFSASFLIGDVSGDGKNSLLVALDGMIHVYNVTDPGDYELMASFKGSNPVLADMDKNGVYEIVVSSVSNEKPGVMVLSGSGQELWSYHVDYDLEGNSMGFNAMRDFAIGDFNGDGIMDIAIGLQNTYPLGRTAIIDGASKELVFITPATVQIAYVHGGGVKVDRATLAQPGRLAVADIDNDGKDELYMVSLEAFMRISQSSEEFVLDTYVAQISPDLCRIYYSTPYIFDLNSDGTQDYFFGAGFNSVSAYSGKMNMTTQTRVTNSMWHMVVNNYNELMYRDQGIALRDINGDKEALIGIQITSGPPDEKGSFAVYDGASGSMYWRYDMKDEFGGSNVSAKNIIACDVNNDGNMEYIVATNTGYVIAFTTDDKVADNSERILWSANIAASVSNIAIGDIYNDGTSQIVLAANDGYIYIIDGREEGNDIVIPTETDPLPTTITTQTTVTNNSDDTGDKPDGSNNKSVIYVMIIALIVLVIAGLVVYLIRKRKNPNVG